MTRDEIKPLLVSLLSALFILTLLRLGFYYYFIPPDAPLPTNLLLQSLYIGAKFDLRLLIFIHLPLVILSVFPWFKPGSSNIALNIWRVYFILAFTLVLATYTMDFGYYAYLETRLDASILRFAYNLDTSIQMVWQTYPVVWIGLVHLLVFLLLVTAVTLLWRRVQNTWSQGRFKRIGSVTMIAFIMLATAWAKFSWYPLRWSDAYYSTNEFASKLALNPVLYFTDTLKNQNIDYSEDAVRQNYALMADFLGVDNSDPKSLSFRRERQPDTSFAHQPNIVIVLLESFAWYKTGLSGNPFNPTPNIDGIARKGLSFNRFYAPHGGTARSVWALMTGIPDIEMNKTSSRNPLIVNQHTIVNAFEGYEKFYFLGGSANWANIRGLLSNNIPGLQIYEEGSYQSERIDVWGISDLHLFEEADKVLQKQTDPFFAIIQTSGNHRPYTIPEDNRGFEVLSPDANELKKHGFRSVPDYNAMRFMDHSIGFFMQQASKSDYYNDTIFVFLADHGNMRHATHLPAYVEKLGLTEFQSPLVIYKPGAEANASNIETLASEIDILPTIAGYASTRYTNTTLGRDILDERHRDQQYVFTVTFGHVPNIGIISQDHYFIMFTDGSKKSLHELNTTSPDKNLIDTNPQLAEQMESMVRAFYETANYMRFNNKQSDNSE